MLFYDDAAVIAVNDLNAEPLDEYVASFSIAATDATVFNEKGTRDRDNFTACFWTDDDPLDKPSSTVFVLRRARTGKNYSVQIATPPGKIRFEQWYWQEDGQWKKSDRQDSQKYFGAGQYWTDFAIFFFEKALSDDTVAVGGTVKPIP